MDQSWGYGGQVRSGDWNSWQGSQQRHRGRGGGGWQRSQNPNYNYNNYQPRQRGWAPRHHPNQNSYYQNQNQFQHRGGSGGYRPRTPYNRPPRPPLDTSNIDNWILPAMWEDPWTDLMQQFEPRREAQPPNPVSLSQTSLNPSETENDRTLQENSATPSAFQATLQMDGAAEESSEESKGQNNSPAAQEEPNESPATPTSAIIPDTVTSSTNLPEIPD